MKLEPKVVWQINQPTDTSIPFSEEARGVKESVRIVQIGGSFFVEISMQDAMNKQYWGSPDGPISPFWLDVLVRDYVKTKQKSDTEMLDWLDENARGYGLGWICRDSSTGRGLRLHETSDRDASKTVREAIAAAMEIGLKNRSK